MQEQVNSKPDKRYHADSKNWETIPRSLLLIDDIIREKYVIVKGKWLKFIFTFIFSSKFLFWYFYI